MSASNDELRAEIQALRTTLADGLAAVRADFNAFAHESRTDRLDLRRRMEKQTERLDRLETHHLTLAEVQSAVAESLAAAGVLTRSHFEDSFDAMMADRWRRITRGVRRVVKWAIGTLGSIVTVLVLLDQVRDRLIAWVT